MLKEQEIGGWLNGPIDIDPNCCKRVTEFKNSIKFFDPFSEERKRNDIKIKEENKGILYKTRCYLAGAMEKSQDGRGWRDKVKKELQPLDIVCLDPYLKPFVDHCEENEEVRKNLMELRNRGEFELISKRMKRVRQLDLRQVDLADFIVCHLDSNVPTVGTIEELAVAERQSKVVFISFEEGIKSCNLWLFGMFDYKYFYNSIDESIEMIKKINNSKVEIDSDRWKLLDYQYR